jgi:hypothetical protein
MATRVTMNLNRRHSLIALASTMGWVHGCNSEQETEDQPRVPPGRHTAATKAPAPREVPPNRKPDHEFRFASTERHPQSDAVFDVAVWVGRDTVPCVARVASDDVDHIAALRKSIDIGAPSGRISVSSEILSRCTGRFVYLDGGSGTPGVWEEFIGFSVADVTHVVRVNSTAANALILELTPGVAPTRAAEIARVEKLINDVDRAMATGTLQAVLAERRVVFVAALQRLQASEQIR